MCQIQNTVIFLSFFLSVAALNIRSATVIPTYFVYADSCERQRTWVKFPRQRDES